MSEYTPKTWEIKHAYVSHCERGDWYERDIPEMSKEFDRWLAERDAEVAEETLNTVIMLLNSELEETEPHPEEARGLRRALQIVFLLATRQGPRYET